MLGLAPADIALRRTGAAAPGPVPITTVLIEGDSITFAAQSFARQYAAAPPTGTTVVVNAANSRTIGGPDWAGPPPEGADAGTPVGNSLLLQRGTDLASGAQLIATMIGANDLATFSPANYRSRVAGWAGPVRAAGVKIAWSPPHPYGTNQAHGSYADFTARRAALLATCRDPAVWGQWADHYLPIGEHPDFAAADNMALISTDGVHPTQAGQNALFEVWKAALDSLLDANRAGATRMYGSAWPVSETGLATATPIVRRFVVKGIAHRGLALTGGNSLVVSGGGAEVRVNAGAWGASAAGWLYNGDTVEFRLTTSAEFATATAIDLQVGSETRTLSYATGADVAPVTYAHGDVVNVQPQSTAHDFLDLPFAAGMAVLAIKAANANAAVLYGPAGGPAGERVPATRLWSQTASGTGTLEVWTFPVAAAGLYDVAVTASGWRGQTTMSYGSVQNAQGALAQIDSAAPADEGQPHATGALTVPTNGLALAFFGEYGGASITPATANAGTALVDEGSGVFQGETHGVAVAARTTSGAASFAFAFGTWPRGAVVFRAAGS